MSNLSKFFSGILDEIDNSLSRSADNRMGSSVRYSPLGYRNVSQPHTRPQGPGMRQQGSGAFGIRQTNYPGSQTPGYYNTEAGMQSGAASSTGGAMKVGRAGSASGTRTGRVPGRPEKGKEAGAALSELRSKVEERQLKQQDKTGFKLDLSDTSLLNAIILGEVLGKPKCFGKGR